MKYKKILRISPIAVLLIGLVTSSGCSEQPDTAQNNPEPGVFSVNSAKDNLRFAKDQYLKMIDHLEHKRHLKPKPACANNPEMICVPRSQEHDGIQMDQSNAWTNGFFPGLLWKLLAEKEHISTWGEGEEEKLFETAKLYQKTLFSQATRSYDHDLGFILYDSFGEALAYEGLSNTDKNAYLRALETARATLANRYSDEKGLIRSWDFTPMMRLATLEAGDKVLGRYGLANPWAFPVIIDNMMNLELLLDSKDPLFHKVAFDHAKQTINNHYFYDESDAAQQYPIAYHVFDYGEFKPGNWQGMGNISAWSRGQGWSLYGFVTIVEAMEKAKISLDDYPDFRAHLMRLYNSVEHFLQDELVPYWDLFATRSNAFEYAENTSDETAVFSGILVLCDKLIEGNILPYNGYRPMTLDAEILSRESLAQLEGKQSWYGEPIIRGDKLLPCGSAPYPKSHTKIPRDSSAAALIAAALYRYANLTDDLAIQQKFADLADVIMAELTKNYRVDRSKADRPESLDLGFVLSEATGNMGIGDEIDTPIVYGDFYFVEANIRKIEFEESR